MARILRITVLIPVLLLVVPPAFADTPAAAQVRLLPSTVIPNGTGMLALGSTPIGVPLTSPNLVFENVPDTPDPVEQMENVSAMVTVGFTITQQISPLFIPGGATRGFLVQCSAAVVGPHTGTVAIIYSLSSVDPVQTTGPFSYNFTVTCLVTDPSVTTTSTLPGIIPASGASSVSLAVAATLMVVLGALTHGVARRRSVRNIGA